jgi:hypothetical protein
VAFEFGLVLDLNRFEDFGNSENLGLHKSIAGPYSKFNYEGIMQHSFGELNQKCQNNQISSSTIEAIFVSFT